MDERESSVSRATRHDLQEWLVDALSAHGGSATIVQVCEHVWANHEQDLRASGDLFYTWQYDIRWAATKLRKRSIMAPAAATQVGTWSLRMTRDDQSTRAMR